MFKIKYLRFFANVLPGIVPAHAALALTAGEQTDMVAAHVTDWWGDEQQRDDHAANTCARGQVYGHDTRAVWRGATEIGCARTVCDEQSQVWACHDAPPGHGRRQNPY